MKVGSTQQVIVSTTGGALSLYGTDGRLTRDIQQQGAGGEGALNLFESAAVGDVDGARGPDVVKYQIDLGQAAAHPRRAALLPGAQPALSSWSLTTVFQLRAVAVTPRRLSVSARASLDFCIPPG